MIKIIFLEREHDEYMEVKASNFQFIYGISHLMCAVAENTKTTTAELVNMLVKGIAILEDINGED